MMIYYRPRYSPGYFIRLADRIQWVGGYYVLNTFTSDKKYFDFTESESCAWTLLKLNIKQIE